METHVTTRWIRWARWTTAIAAATIVWTTAILLSGFSFVQLLPFTGPGVVLALAARWASRVFDPEAWNMDDALRAALSGAMLFPPIVALFVAWTATLEPNTMAVLFILGAWFALAAGFIHALLRVALRRRAFRRQRTTAHVELIQ